MKTVLQYAAIFSITISIGIVGNAVSTLSGKPGHEPVMPAELSGAGSSMGTGVAPPQIAMLSEDECLGYSSKDHYLIVAYINLLPSPRAVSYDYSGVGSSVSELTHNVGRGYRLLPLTRDGNAGRLIVRVRQQDSDPISDSPRGSLYNVKVSELAVESADALGIRCDGSVPKKRRASR